jgi:hypothetical protein
MELPGLYRHCIEDKVTTVYFRNDKRVKKAVQLFMPMLEVPVLQPLIH